jgi:hypothetical protein
MAPQGSANVHQPSTHMREGGQVEDSPHEDEVAGESGYLHHLLNG